MKTIKKRWSKRSGFWRKWYSENVCGSILNDGFLIVGLGNDYHLSTKTYGCDDEKFLKKELDIQYWLFDKMYKENKLENNNVPYKRYYSGSGLLIKEWESGIRATFGDPYGRNQGSMCKISISVPDLTGEPFYIDTQECRENDKDLIEWADNMALAFNSIYELRNKK